MINVKYYQSRGGQGHFIAISPADNEAKAAFAAAGIKACYHSTGDHALVGSDLTTELNVALDKARAKLGGPVQLQMTPKPPVVASQVRPKPVPKPPVVASQVPARATGSDAAVGQLPHDAAGPAGPAAGPAASSPEAIEIALTRLHIAIADEDDEAVKAALTAKADRLHAQLLALSAPAPAAPEVPPAPTWAAVNSLRGQLEALSADLAELRAQLGQAFVALGQAIALAPSPKG